MRLIAHGVAIVVVVVARAKLQMCLWESSLILLIISNSMPLQACTKIIVFRLLNKEMLKTLGLKEHNTNMYI